MRLTLEEEWLRLTGMNHELDIKLHALSESQCLKIMADWPIW